MASRVGMRGADSSKAARAPTVLRGDGIENLDRSRQTRGMLSVTFQSTG
ncbi:MAG: hypothetical protein K0Q61_2406 [Rhodococcus erythropolis]|jgi:hypothetical protein|nr:hypothetical protein [Rhodococcus erythropolis]